jgi:hypothetical protein
MLPPSLGFEADVDGDVLLFFPPLPLLEQAVATRAKATTAVMIVE